MCNEPLGQEAGVGKQVSVQVLLDPLSKRSHQRIVANA